MLAAEQIEELLAVVAAMDRPAILAQFRTYRASFPLDFSDAFLAAQSLDRLRHLFTAVCLQTKRLPAAEPTPLATDAA